MNNSWTIQRLDEIVDFQRGLTYSKKDEVDFSTNVVLRATNIDVNSNSLNLQELRYIDDKIQIPDSKRVKKDSLIICTASGSKSHLGKVALIDEDYDYAFGGFMGQISPRNGLDSKFLYYALTSENYKTHIAELSDGVNINNLKFDDLRPFEIPVPSLAEQKRIVAILDKAFEAIAKAKQNAEKNLQNARELFESHLQSVFTECAAEWESKKLKDFAQVLGGYSFKVPISRRAGNTKF